MKRSHIKCSIQREEQTEAFIYSFYYKEFDLWNIGKLKNVTF